MDSQYRKLFESFNIKNLEIKNRFVMCPMGIVSNTADGVYTQDAVEYFVRRAQGGVGLIITGAHWVENDIEKHVSAFFPCPTQNPEQYIKMAGQMTERIHAYGTKIFLQLTAGFGRSAVPFAIKGDFVAPSPITNRWNSSIECRALATEEVERIVKKFAEAAVIAKKAGFDGIEIHAVHEGYLLDCFTMAFFNKRTDKYGGDLQGRLRFAIEIIQEIKAACGKNFPVILRFSIKSYIKALRQGGLPGEEFEELGRDLAEGLEVAKLLEAAGYDAFDADAGSYDSWYWAHPPMYFKKGMYLSLAEELKKVVNVPVIVAGRTDDPDLACKALSEGQLDAVGLARPLLADPELPNKIRTGNVKAIRPCLSCHDGCFGRMIQDGKISSCAVNPNCNRELIADIKPANNTKNIMIIGGGVAGMEAARVCALRGHTVALYEASDKLGGNLNPAGVPDFKEDDRALIKWYENELFVHGIEVNMNTEINKEMVLDMHPDTVFVATGSRPVKLKLPGIDKENVYNAIEVLLGEKEVGSTCVIVGGGLVGAELALWLATKGKKVTILEVLNDILQAGAPLVAMNNWMLRDLLKLHKVDIKTNSCIVGVTNQGVIIKTQNGEEFLGVDTVIMAVGSKKENRLYEELKFDISEIFNIGDSREVRNIQGSIWDAYEVARSI